MQGRWRAPRRLAAALLAIALFLPGALATPVAAATPSPWQGSVDLYQPAAFTTQPDYVTCVPAAAQIMRNIIQGTSDHSTTEIRAWYTWGRSQTFMPYSVAGLDPLAWARILSQYGAGPYVDRSFATFDAAVAARDHGPLLLVRWSSIPDPIAAELARLTPAKVVVLGGLQAVSDSVAGF